MGVVCILKGIKLIIFFVILLMTSHSNQKIDVTVEYYESYNHVASGVTINDDDPIVGEH